MATQLRTAFINTNHTTSKILLIAPACGRADELAFLQKELDDQFDLHLSGCDFNEESIKKAQQKFPNDHFALSTLDQLTTFFQNLHENIYPLFPDKKICKVIIFSGVLARAVSENMGKALKYLQFAVREEADYIVTASHTESFIDQRTAKAAGLKAVKITAVPARKIIGGPVGTSPVSLYRKPTDEERATDIVNRSNKRKNSLNSNIDLSYSSNPVKDLQSLLLHAEAHLNRSTQLDLSWCHITESEIPVLAKQISTTRISTIIICTLDQEWSRYLKKLLPEKKFFIRTDSPNEHAPAYASIPSLRRFGLLHQIPVTPLKDQADSNVKEENKGKKN